MSTVGFGITCFGDELYFKGTQHKLDNLLLKGHCCYVLTDNSDFFMQRYQSQNLSGYPTHTRKPNTRLP